MRWLRRKRNRWLCPHCGSPFFTVTIGLARRKNRMPEITSMSGLLTCADCGSVTGYDEQVRLERPEKVSG
jgi:RNase P subunit RPR2